MRSAHFALAALCTLPACRADQPRLASAGTLPAGIHLIGPQPGVDRLIAEAVNPYANDRTVLNDGRRLFVWFNCAGCHGDHAGGGMGPSLRDSTWIYGDYSKPDPPADLIRAVEHDSVDVAIVWGPLGGYFAKRSRVPLTVTPLPAEGGTRDVPMRFSIAAGVRHGDTALRRQVQASLDRHRRDIREILDRYGVPVVAAARR